MSRYESTAAPRALYVHVPFCSRRCSYCDFAVEVAPVPPVEEWLDSVTAELSLICAEQVWDEPLRLDTLYVGGGTPSLLGGDAMAALVARLSEFGVLQPGAEWTCEANPESFTQEVAEGWRAAGVNRISLGAQTFDADTLRWMGRLHGPDGPGLAVQAARAAGFENVSVDLIFGLPERLPRDLRRDVEAIIDLAPEHVSLYGLTAEPGAPLGRWVREGREVLADEDRYAEEFLLAHRLLTDAGFDHYEVSNFARPGRESRHNQVYWDGAPYLAVGPGAHAFLPPERRWNLRSWSAYRESLRSGRLPLEDRERLTSEAEALERVWLGLRTRRGYDLAHATVEQEGLARDWVREGLAVLEQSVLRLTPRGWLLLDELAERLDAAAAHGSPRHRSIDARRGLVQISDRPQLT